ncbi:MAG: site-specific DNA-methyltransferase [bacterium]
MQNLYNDLEKLLKRDERLFAEGKILKNKVSELAIKLDTGLIELLFKDKNGKEHFFIEVAGKFVFDKDKFLKFINNKEFLPNSFTAFKNHIGLAEGDDYLKDSGKVVLAWPYKDCVLEGGQDKEDIKRNEIFYNEILAPDEIDRLFEPKVLTNFKKIDKTGEHKVEQITEQDNLIIKGNNLLTLHSLKKKYRGKIKLIYIDPPYNTGNDTFKYNDSFNHSTWLTFIKNRLEIAKQLLTEDGSIYVQADSNEVHYLKVLLDEIFGKENLQREIIWYKGNMFGYAASADNFVLSHDTILFYSKSKNKIFNKLYDDYSEEYIKERFRHNDNDGKGLYRLQGKNQKQYLSESRGVPMPDVWTIPIVNVMAKENVFQTQKPEALIKRILEASTNEGDIILDFMAGSGTTGIVALKMKRQFIICEQIESQCNIANKRFERTFKGEGAGISKIVNWKGGGSFIYMELAQWNENYMRAIQEAKTTKELASIYKKMQAEAFFRYEIDLSKFKEKQFIKLSLDDQKKVLLECLDKNHFICKLQ